MPCGAKPRGFADQYIPWSDWIGNNACGTKIVTSVAGVSTSAAALCPFHWMLANGQSAWVGPIVLEP